MDGEKRMKVGGKSDRRRWRGGEMTLDREDRDDGKKTLRREMHDWLGGK